MDFLRKDLPHLFDDQGIDKDAYEEVVEFIDPITRYNKLSGEQPRPATVASLHPLFCVEPTVLHQAAS